MDAGCCAWPLLEGTAARNNHRMARDGETTIGIRPDVVAGSGIVQGRSRIQDHTASQDGPLADPDSFKNPAISSDKNIVFDDDGLCSDGFQYATDLYPCREVYPFPNLCTGTYKYVGVNQGVGIDVGTDVDVGRRHDDHTRSQVGSSADAGASRNDADAVFGRKDLQREGVFFPKMKVSFVHGYELTVAEAF